MPSIVPVVQVLINQCASWLLHGLLVDPCGEFFVHKNFDPTLSAAGTATRSSMATNPDEIWNDNENDRWTALNDSVEGAWEGAVDWRAEEEWNSTYTLRLPLVPTSFVPHGLAQKMLFVGKVVRVLCQANTLSLSTSAAPPSAWPGDSAVGDGVGDGVGGDVGVSEAEVLELTQRWSELRDREDFHLLALERAVHEAHSLVDRRLYRLLVNVAGLEGHLSSLKRLFLMGHGSLFHSFLDKAREAMKVKAGERAVLDLNTWLAAAVEDTEGHDSDGAAPSSASTLDRARLDLDPPGFSCKAFQDLARQGFCVRGAAIHSSRKPSVCLCPGDYGRTSSSPKRSASSSSSSLRVSRPRAAPTAPPPTGAGAGWLWYTSDREVHRGFRSSVAFRCDRHKPSPDAIPGSAPQETCGAQVAGPAGPSLSFVVHQHRAALSGSEESAEEGIGISAMVPNSLSVRLEPDGEGGGQVSIRWNPHRSPSLPRPDVDIGTFLAGTTNRRDASVGEVDGDNLGRGQSKGKAVHLLGRATLPNSCGLSLGQVNYLMVDYSLGERPRPRRDERDEAGSRERGLGVGAELMVFVNDPGRSGSPVLSVKLDMWKLIELGGGHAFVGVSAEGPWRTTLRQWDFHLGCSSTTVGKPQTSSGPLGGVRSGPRVEEMLEAMDSWSGLCLHYRLEWPMHLVLTRETMQTYNRLFRLLACVKRANLELERVWPALMQSRYRGLANEEGAWLGPLWMLRARMAFFVSNLAFYLQVDVVEAAYTLLRSKLVTVRDFVSLQRAHQEFLATLRAKFYVDNLAIAQGLGRALRHVLRFCCLFSLHGNAKDILPSEVMALHDAFQDEMKLLVPVLEKVAKELMMRLDFNGHFSAEALN
ncbi:unnamed protein product [Ectocarpus sp. CCAP 1310/34]|nr:unnamed protein product [Ectocarpus sp. CCAP 1310/34]